MREFEAHEIGGSPSRGQERVIIAALQKLMEEKHPQSKWKMRQRVAALGVGGTADLRGRGDVK